MLVISPFVEDVLVKRRTKNVVKGSFIVIMLRVFFLMV